MLELNGKPFFMNKKLFGLAYLLLLVAVVHAQNKPKLSETGPVGTLVGGIDDRPVDYSPGLQLHNYSRTWLPQKPVQDAGLVNENSSPWDVLQSSQYVDGLGNGIQQITRFGISKDYHSVQIADPRAMGDQSYNFLPYAVPQAQGSFRHNAFTEQKDYYTNLYPDEQNTAFSKSKVIIDGNGHTQLKQYSPGLSQVGQARGVTSETFLDNVGGQISKYTWDPIDLEVDLNGTYGAGQLVYTQTTAEHGKLVRQYNDLEGKTICKVVLADNQNSVYEYSYYVNDELGRLIVTIPPNAINAAGVSGIITSDILNKLCIRNVYDEIGRLIQKAIPDQVGVQEVVYDKWHRPVLTQDPVLQSQGKWLFTLYDDMGRGVMTGILTSNQNRGWWQYVLDGTGSLPGTLPSAADLADANQIYTYLLNGLQLIQGAQAYPASINNANIQTYVFFDHYNHGALAGFSFDQTYTSHIYPDAYTLDYAQVPALRTMPVRGLVTGTKERILKDQITQQSSLGDWITSVTYYNNEGEAIQTQRKIEKLQNTSYYKDIVTTMTDFRGRPVRVIMQHNNVVNAGVGQTVNTDMVVQKYLYEEKTFKPTGVRQRINNQQWANVSSTYYASNTGVAALRTLGAIENQNYTYNIRGQLTGINASYAETETSMNNVTFGESIKYDYGFDNPRYDGQIAGILWKTPSPRSRAYGYSYTTNDRLTEADFNQFDGSGSLGVQVDWKKSQIDLSEKSITYDKNGNILSLNRYGPTSLAGNFQLDHLIYTYETNTNKLQSVSESWHNSIVPGTPVQEFIDGNTGSADYDYDANGNQTKDFNKGVSNIVYNHMDKPVRYTFASGSVIEYIYSAGGQKLEEINTPDQQPTTHTTYIGAFVYKNEVQDLMYHSEGRARKVTNANGSTWEYDYFVKDHLGNVRTTVTPQVIPWNDYFAQHELAYANVEQMVFDNIDLVRSVRPGTPQYNNNDAARLDANDPEKRIGTAILLHVMAGDKFSLMADAYYDAGAPTGQTGNVGANDMLESIVGTLLGGQSTGFNNEGISGGEVVNNVFTESNYVTAYNELLNQNTDTSKPRSYLNYLVFDEQFHLIPEQSGAIQIGAGNTWHILETANEIELNQGGYLAVYISNESKQYLTYFDNLHIQILKGRLQEENHYYPYGLCLRMSQASGVVANKHLYQTKELTGMVGANDHLNLYDFHARQYDPILGRFTAIDPMGQYPSGYVGMGNNPVMMVDPDGMNSFPTQILYNLLSSLNGMTFIEKTNGEVTNRFTFHWGGAGGLGNDEGLLMAPDHGSSGSSGGGTSGFGPDALYAESSSSDIFELWLDYNRPIDDFTPYIERMNNYMTQGSYLADERKLNDFIQGNISDNILDNLQVKSITVGSLVPSNINDKRGGLYEMDVFNSQTGLGQDLQLWTLAPKGPIPIDGSTQRIFAYSKRTMKFDVYYGVRIQLSPTLLGANFNQAFLKGIIGHELIHAYHNLAFNRESSHTRSGNYSAAKSEAYAYYWHLQYSITRNLQFDYILKIMERDNLWQYLFLFDQNWYFYPFY